jgi:hypothetical protein
MLVVDDILGIPGKIGGIVINSLYQTVRKTTWIAYQKKLSNALIKAKHAREMKIITEGDYKELESHIFKEMRIARNMLKSE